MVYVQYDENENGEWPMGVRIFWNMFSRAFFILGLALVLLPTFTGKLRGISAFLGSTFWTPLARLTFSTYLIHIPVMYWNLGSQRTAHYVQTANLWFLTFSCATASYILAIPFSMLFEVPFMNLEKFILFPTKDTRRKDQGEQASLVKREYNIHATVSLRQDLSEELVSNHNVMQCIGPNSLIVQAWKGKSLLITFLKAFNLRGIHKR